MLINQSLELKCVQQSTMLRAELNMFMASCLVMSCGLYCAFKIIEDSIEVPATKKRRISFGLLIISSLQSWSSEFNLDGKVETSQKEVGVDASMLEAYMVWLLL